jgi:GT2 family glycosyltransferase
MPDRPLIDVIILSMDRTEDTINAIASALEQNGVTKHIWVVDQGSRPENLEMLKTYVADKIDVHLETLPHNLGVAGGRNIATSFGRAPYVVALDNDAIFADTGMLRRTVDYMNANPDLGAIGFQILNYFSLTNDDRSWGYPKALLSRWREEFDTTMFIGAGHALRRDVFERAGGYDDRLFFCMEEIDLCYRIINLGYGVRYVPHLKVYHKVSPEHRVSWTGDRFYYLVRNRLYHCFKYGRALPVIICFALGYMVKGFNNGVLGQSLRAARDAVAMSYRLARSSEDKSLYHLSERAMAYIHEHDISYRGNLWFRIRKEVLAKLPGTTVTPEGPT